MDTTSSTVADVFMGALIGAWLGNSSAEWSNRLLSVTVFVVSFVVVTVLFHICFDDRQLSIVKGTGFVMIFLLALIGFFIFPEDGLFELFPKNQLLVLYIIGMGWVFSRTFSYQASSWILDYFQERFPMNT